MLAAVLGTYASFLILLGAAGLVGQAIFAAAGRRELSRLAPAVGLAALCPLAWWTVRLPGEGVAAAIALGLATLVAAACLRGRVRGLGPALRRDLPIAVAALVLGSLPFIVEARFGILGTGLNPDMSQHLFATDRLAAGVGERLISEGYPLGPHSLVVAIVALGPSSVAAFNGLMLATAVAACLAPLALLDGLAGWRRMVAALCAGFAYLVAAFYVQGSFKETLQALFLVAFAIGLMRLAQRWPTREGRTPRPLRALALAVLAIGSVYVYSFPGLAWLAGAFGLWAAIELGRAARRGGGAQALRLVRLAAPTALAALALIVVAIAPELGRLVEFASFETFDPAGAGLGNLFDRLSPAEALGIWPSGDFRLEPGDGFAPAIAFYLGAAFGLAALAFGLVWWLRRGERALPAALAAAGLLWLGSLLAGTPYQESKALLLAAALVALISARALAAGAAAAVTVAFAIAAGGSSVLALANGPVGPSGYSPALAELASRLGQRSAFVYAPAQLLSEQHGLDYLLWELRGHRICVERLPAPSKRPPNATTVTIAVPDGAVVPETVYRSVGPASANEPCPLVED